MAVIQHRSLHLLRAALRAARAPAPARVLCCSPVCASLPTSAPASDVRQAAAVPRRRRPKPLTLSRLSRMYLQLSKVRLSAFVAGTATMGFVMAGPVADWQSLAAVTAGTLLASASANTWNQLYEVASDARMARTRARPLPSGRISRQHATGFGLATAAGAAAVLAAGTNPLTTALGLGNIALYSAVYTPLKKVTPWNTDVGAVVGAIPPLMGWAAATGTALAPGALAAAALLHLWQMPHFYALAWRHRADYAAGGYAMLSVTEPTGTAIGKWSLAHTAGLAALPFLCVAGGVTSPMFAVCAAPINAYALYTTAAFAKAPDDAGARRVFLWSLWYLPLMMGLMVFFSTEWGAGERGGGEHVGDARRALGQALCPHETSRARPDEAQPAAELKAAACPATALEAAVKVAVAR